MNPVGKHLPFAYDVNGNTPSIPNAASLTCDFENSMTQAIGPGANGGTIFKYDPSAAMGG